MYDALQENRKLITPYILTCSACLEYFLNDLLQTYAQGHWGSRDYHSTARALLSMQLKKKLDIIVPLLSDHRYLISASHPTYRRLVDLITVRNTIIHNKPPGDIEYDVHFEGNKVKGLLVDSDRWNNLLKQSPEHFKYSDCKKYHNALLDFIKRIFIAHYHFDGKPYQFRENKLILRNRHKNSRKDRYAKSIFIP